MYFIAKVLREEGAGEGIDYVQGDVTGWELQLVSDKEHVPVDFEYVSLWSETHDFETAEVVDDGNGNPVLQEDADKVALRTSEEEIALRVKRIQFGQRLIAIMSIRNDAKSLTGAQIVQLVQDFADINTAWLNGSIQTSRGLVDALTPDETILTTADKTAILAEIDANLTELGY